MPVLTDQIGCAPARTGFGRTTRLPTGSKNTSTVAAIHSWWIASSRFDVHNEVGALNRKVPCLMTLNGGLVSVGAGSPLGVNARYTRSTIELTALPEVCLTCSKSARCTRAHRS